MCCCVICGLLDIRAAVYVGCRMLGRILYGMWAVCVVSGLLYDMWAAGYMGCSICGLLNSM